MTNSVRWVTTNTAVSRFVGRGRFEFTAPGTTVIYAEDSRLFSDQAIPYTFEADGSVRQPYPFEVWVGPPGGGFLPFATVEFTPEGGQTQTCQLGAGAPYTPCRFWVDLLDRNIERFGLTPAVVVASKPGYSSVRQSVTPQRPVCNGCPPNGLVVRLTPSS